MSEWLSSLWEPNWRPFRYYNLYRLLLAVTSAISLRLPQPWTDPFHLARSDSAQSLLLAYTATIAAGLLAAVRWPRYFSRQLTFQVGADIVAFTTFMYFAGGVSSGLGLLLLVSLTAASLVGRSRLVLLYAALATLCVLGQQTLAILHGDAEVPSIVSAGVLSAGFFGTAILARLLGQRAMFNEELARRRGLDLENQHRINQRMLERMQDGVLVVAPDGRIVRSNPVAVAMLALPEGRMVGLGEGAPALAEAYAGWRAGRLPDTVELRGDGGLPLRARFEATTSTSGEAVVFLEDMASLQAQAQQLKLASLGRLTASIAHEIRNPLAAISHAGELLHETPPPEVQQRLLRILGDNVGRLDRIVRDILELGRRDRAHREIIELAVFLPGFVEEFVAVEHLPAEALALECPASLRLDFDRMHLRQVLWNLLANARRHGRGEPGGIRLVGGKTPAGRVELQVYDDGDGVPDEVRMQIFEPFFTTDARGTGLGLFIARDLCEANGARLELGDSRDGGHFVLSAPGVGA